ncbi:hypothetical protein ANN_11209 [Periplaneta americana]|uniref:Uncharacterized protein n=1 Tax=Periplaneta americana TaxID=6978 RepID=A0ABQ8T4D8_PERAM|nr:hypothetical protein ANN_11209 [Periplaneta americana]
MARLCEGGNEPPGSLKGNSQLNMAAPFKRFGEADISEIEFCGRYVRTPENIQRVRLAVQRSPSRSAVRHAAALRISDRTVRRILHKAHTARDKLRLLRNFFPGCIISRFGNIDWPARSPDLTAPDFFLWGHLKARDFQTRPHSIQDLKNRIQAEVQEINETPGLLLSDMNNFCKQILLEQVWQFLAVRAARSTWEVAVTRSSIIVHQQRLTMPATNAALHSQQAQFTLPNSFQDDDHRDR